MRKALTIAGSDPSGGAGIQADLKVFHAFGIYGFSVVSALTAQNSSGVRNIMAVRAEFVKKQLTVLLSDIIPDATKTGMLFSVENVEAVAGIIRRHSLRNIVVDPVLMSSTGRRLAERDVLVAIRKKLLPLSTVVTPNIHEASELTGIKIKGIKDMEKAALQLYGSGVRSVIITGGHLDKTAVDVLYNGEFYYFEGRKRKGEYHGTGCAFSSAVAAQLADGHDIAAATRKAKEFMLKLFDQSFSSGKGMNLFRI